MDDDGLGEERKVWLESKHSLSYVLMKVQRAFCMRKLSVENFDSNLTDALNVLLKMDRRTGYP